MPDTPDTTTEPAAEAVEAPAAEPEAQAAEESKPGRDWHATLEYLQKVDPDAYQHASGMRADYTRKTQELAERSRHLEAKEQQLAQTEGRIKSLMEQLAGAQDGELPEFDPFDPDSVAAHAERRFYEKHIKPLEQKAAEQAAAVELEKVKSQHPDIFGDEAVQKELVDFLTERPHYKLEDGIEVIKARLKERSLKASAERESAEREARRETALRGTRAPKVERVTRRMPPREERKKMSNRELLELSKELDAQRR